MTDHRDVSEDQCNLAALSTHIVCAYVENNALPANELPRLIADVYGALKHSSVAAHVPKACAAPVPPSESVTTDYIVCLEDGKKFKSLKRHLKVYYGLTPEQYRRKWDLPSSYPMVAPNFAALRSNLARKSGLGRKVHEVQS